MYSIDEYRIAGTLEEAAQLLLASRRNALIAGGTWLRMGKTRIHTAIDLTRLGLDTIRETDEYIEIGACVTLRQLETCELIWAHFDGVLSAAVRNIVGVQFRNSAQVGANVYSRYGFSDLLTALLALDARVALHTAGEMSLDEFLKNPPKRDILTCVRVRKDARRASYQSMRRTRTDFAVLNLCLSRAQDGTYRLSVGARPGVAARCEAAEALLAQGDLAGAQAAVRGMTYDTNTRASAGYRRALAGVLLERAWNELQEAAK